MAVKKTQMYRRNLDGTETNLNPLTESQYVLMENGQTVQEVLSDRDSDKYTPVITNSSSTFKVGQGDNVDLSSSMKEGAYDSCVLKGKTMVNCIQESSSRDVVLPYEFAEGQYVTINDTKESGALGVELKGQTLVNLCKNSGKDLIYTNINSSTSLCYKIKDNTWYYLIINVKQNTLNKPFRFSGWTLAHGATPMSGTEISVSDKDVFDVGETGVKRFKIGYSNIPEDKGKSLIMFTADSSTTTGQVTYDIMLLEYQDGMENWDIPYFEGMTSCKMPILHTVGENLFDNSTTQKYYTTSDGVWTSANNNRSTDFIRVKGDCKYHAKCFVSGAGNPAYAWFDANKNFIKRDNHQGGVVTSPSNAHYVKAHVGNIDTELTNENFLMTVSQTNTQITEHKNYKSSILSLPEEVVLRSLPNGVCDTFNARTGVYTQRIGEVVLNGQPNISWESSSYSSANHYAFYTRSVKDAKNIMTKIYCDSLPSNANLNECQLDREGCILNTDSQGWGNVWIKLSSQKIENNTTSLKTYLQSNPVTIQYELKTPIVTKVNLSSILKSWNTTTHIYSEIPENTLYPTLSHSNPSYPVILKPSTKYSIVANSYSNSHASSAINFNLGGATASTTVGNRVTTVTTPSTLSNELLTMSGRGSKLNNVMVIEGDVVGDEPYFEGICDCKSPILSNVGKNLCNVNRYTLSCGSGVALNGYGKTVIAKNIKAKPNTTYTFSYGNTVNIPSSVRLKVMTLTDVVDEDVHVNVYSHKNRIYEHSVPNGGSFTTEGGTRYIAITTGNFTTTGDILIEDIEIKEATSPTTYESYKSNATTFEQKDDKTIVLRSLPNGVCDTLNVETGEYVQRIGELVANGDDTITYSGISTTANNTVRMVINHPSIQINPNETVVCAYCDRIKYQYNYQDTTDIESFFVAKSNSRIFMRLEKSKLETLDVAGIKKYLSKTPYTFQYELIEPIVSTIDVQGFPYAYTNGHVQLSSGSIEQSLTPKVEYSLSANKTGQINSNTKRVSAHQKQLDDFEAMMLTQMVQSAYDKAILQFDYEMQMMSLGGE